MDKAFKVKIDKSTIIRAVVQLIIFAGYFYYIMHLKDFGWIWIWPSVFVLIIISFSILQSFFISYKITKEGVLIVPAGIRKIKINIEEISSVVNEKSWIDFQFKSYVTSLEQLKVTYGKNKEITISPEEKSVFIRALQNLNAGIVIS